MTQIVLPALLNGVLVAGGLFILWSFVSRMRDASRSARARAALFAGAAAVAVTLVATAAIRALT
jgi:hypothetical protein